MRQKPQILTDFSKKVYTVVEKIPEGKTLTYGEVARLIGAPRAARAVGTVLSKNFNPKIPCHRVIRADGQVGGYNRGGNRKKSAILRREGAL